MDNNVVLKFSAGDICMKLKTISMEEFEQALLCVLGPWSDYDRYTYLEYPAFWGEYCNRFYVKKFWEYFTVEESYAITQHVGLFITCFRVSLQDCKPQEVIERLLDKFHTQQRDSVKRNYGDSEHVTSSKRKSE
jgi:hypothetical protein